MKLQVNTRDGNLDARRRRNGLTNLPTTAMMTRQLPGDAMRLSVILAIVLAVIVIGALWRRGKPPVP